MATRPSPSGTGTMVSREKPRCRSYQAMDGLEVGVDDHVVRADLQGAAERCSSGAALDSSCAVLLRRPARKLACGGSSAAAIERCASGAPLDSSCAVLLPAAIHGR